MAKIEDIKEGVKLKTSTGRIGTAYAVTERKKLDNIVDLFFEGSGSVVGANALPPVGVFYIDKLELVE